MLSIRRADPDEAGEVLTVQRAAFVTEAQLHDDPHMTPLTQTLDEIRAVIAAETVLVAVDGTRIVGSVRARLDRGVWQIGRLYERRGYRPVPNDSILIRLTKDREPAS